MTTAFRRTILSLTVVITASLFLASCARDPQKAKTNYVQKGVAYMKKGQYSSAVIEYRNALKIDPTYVDAYIKLAQADEALGDGNSAYAALEKAVEIDPNRVDSRFARAQFWLAVRHFPEAEKDAILHDNVADLYHINL